MKGRWWFRYENWESQSMMDRPISGETSQRSKQHTWSLASKDIGPSLMLVPNLYRGILNPNLHWILFQNKSPRKLWFILPAPLLFKQRFCGILYLFMEKQCTVEQNFSLSQQILQNSVSFASFHIRISSISWLNMMRWCWRTLLFYVSILRKMSLFNLTTSWQK